MILRCTSKSVVIYEAAWVTFKPNLEKEKSTPKKNYNTSGNRTF